MKCSRKDSGAALIIALLAIVIITALSAVLTATVMRNLRIARVATTREGLLNVAESGIVYAAWKLERDEGWPGAEGVAVPGGTCDVLVEVDGAGSHTVASTAREDEQVCAVAVSLEKLEGRGFATADWRVGWNERVNLELEVK